jgi:hypothetical protein
VAPDFLHEHLTVLGLVQTGKGRTLDCGPSMTVSSKRAYDCLPCLGRVSRLGFLLFCEVEVAELRLSVPGYSSFRVERLFVFPVYSAILTIDCMLCPIVTLYVLCTSFYICSVCRCQGRWLCDCESAYNFGLM